MMADKSCCIDLWNSFKDHVKETIKFSYSSENNFVLSQGSDISIFLLLVCDSTMESLTFQHGLSTEISKINDFLCQLEAMCLPQILFLFQQFREKMESSTTLGNANSDTSFRNMSKKTTVVTCTTSEKLNTYDKGLHGEILPGEKKAETEGVVTKERSKSVLKKRKVTSIPKASVRCDSKKKSDSLLENSTNGTLQVIKASSSDSFSLRKSSRSTRLPVKFSEHDVSGWITKAVKPGGEKSSSAQSCIDNKEVADFTNTVKKPSQEVYKKLFTCDTCDKGFLKQSQLKKHAAMHRKLYSCDVCGKTFSVKKKFEVHLMVHKSEASCEKVTASVLSKEECAVKSPLNQCAEHEQSDSGQQLAENENTEPEEGQFQCDFCTKSFNSQTYLKTHLNNLHSESKNYPCELCGKFFSQRGNLYFHMKKKHASETKNYCKCEDNDQVNDENLSSEPQNKENTNCGKCGLTLQTSSKVIHLNKKSRTCDICGKTYSSRKHLLQHSSVHTGEKPFSCEVCGKSFRLRASLKNHLKIHNPSEHKCTLCSKTFSVKKGLVAHLLTHEGVKPYKCSLCQKGFLRETTMNTHMKLHTKEGCYKCDICEKLFLTKASLIKHGSIHTGEKPYSCDVCGKKFRMKKGLVEHSRIHNKDSQYKCDLCPKSFVDKRGLEYHILAHKGEKNHVCEVCGKRFVAKYSLKVHSRRHTGEKPYKCSFCPKAFNQQGTLIAHERCHKGDRPYVCDFCGTGFYTRSHLTIHRRRHTNERPYKCNICNHSSTTSSMLKAHMARHAATKPYQCRFCDLSFKRLQQLESHLQEHTTEDQEVIGEIQALQTISCTFCNMQFVMESDLEAHLQTHEIKVVISTSDEPLLVPKLETDSSPLEVAYDIVLL